MGAPPPRAALHRGRASRFRRLPALQKLYRAGIYWGRETWVAGFAVEPRLFAPVEKLARRHIAREISDPALREKVTPDFRMGCKRILQSNHYYPTLDRDDVDLVTDPIAKVTGDAVVTADGVERPVDVIVVATGFQTTDPPISHRVHGRDGRSLAQTWATSGMAAYKGSAVHGFPNYFSIVGPNTGLGHSSHGLRDRERRSGTSVTRSGRCAPSGGPSSSRAPTPSGPGTPTCSAGWAVRCGTPAAARAGTSTTTAATRCSGRAPR